MRPSLPIASFLSIVAIFDNLIIESFLRPFSNEGESFIPVLSAHFICVEMNETVISRSLATKTSAGLFLLPVRSVKGNGISMISPFFIYIVPLDR